MNTSLWQFPREFERGDLATSVALGLSKKLKQDPIVLAKALADGLGRVAGVERAEAVAPGYVNVWLTPKALTEELRDTAASIRPAETRKGEAPVLVEYSQPNIAKPLGVHHIIGTVLGQTLVNLYRHAGEQVISWNYIGDWGTQFGKLAVSYELWGKGKAVSEYTLDELLGLYVRFHEEMEKDALLEQKGRDAFRKLEQGDRELRAFWGDVVKVTKASLADVYKRLHVSFDLDLGESFYEDKMAGIVEEGKKKGVFAAGEGGALIVAFPAEKDLPLYLILKADGATLYSTRDIAQMRYRIDTYRPKTILICTDVAQKLHFEQLVETCRMLGWELPAFENVIFGRMRFTDKGMSTRKGNIMNLERVLHEAVQRAAAVIREHGDTIQTDAPQDLAEMMGVGALVYGILSQNRKMDMVFDWDRMLSFEGNSAPYLQYTHARARSVLRKAEGEAHRGFLGLFTGKGKPAGVPVVLAQAERLLLRTLLQFPLVLEEARETRLPHKLANYLYALCQDFNKFYNMEPILKAEEPARSFRLHLTLLAADVLKSGAEILTMRVPDRM